MESNDLTKALLLSVIGNHKTALHHI
jgi:hypothetical protein